VRIAATEVARLDALIAHYVRPWFKPTRSDVLRAVILSGLSAVEPLAHPRSGGARAAKAEKKRGAACAGGG
jgi:hypothetical protein